MLIASRRLEEERRVARQLMQHDLAWELLLQAHQCAADVRRSVWDFAVTIHMFRLAGVTDCHMQWMCCKGYVEHAIEVIVPGDELRQFRPTTGLRITPESCFVLTELGRECAEQIVGSYSESPHTPLSPSSSLPCWDAQRRELRVGQTVVKSFQVPAKNQETILAVFQEEGWPSRIDDPLPPVAEIDPRRRLHSTIQCLNRNRKADLLRFHGDGSGTGIRWDRSPALTRKLQRRCMQTGLAASAIGSQIESP